MFEVCISAKCISQILKANNFVFYIVYCIWMAVRICIFANRRGGLVDGRLNKSVPTGRSGRTFIIVLDVLTHDYDVINKLFWSTIIFRAWGCRKFNFSSALPVLCYIIACSSNWTMLVFLDPTKSLLQINYLQNMITALFCRL